MPKSEDGEYELVLGNRQLLSIFFIVVVLLGVGFTLGYMLGRSSVPAAPVAANAADKSREALPPVTAERSPIAVPSVNDLKPSPVDDTAGRPTPKAAAVAKSAPPPPAGLDPKPAASVTGMPPSSHYKTGSPPRGAVFLQVAAVALIDAKAEAEGLASKGFPIWVVPNERTADLFSILVGPYTDRAELSKAKASLEQLGFRKAFRKEIK